MAISDIISALLNPSSQEGYDQGAVVGTNPQTALGAAMAAPTPQQAALTQLMASRANLAPYGYGAPSAVPNTPLGAAMATGMKAAGSPESNMDTYGYPGGAQPSAPQQAPQQAPQDSGPAMSVTGSNQVGFQPGQGAPGDPSLSPIQQQFQNQATNPNLATGMGALMAGGAMLSGKTFGEGMGNAAQAFGQGYQNTLNMQRDLNTPKVIPLADGAFSMVQMPGQQPQVVPNGQVQDFVMGKMKAQVGYDMMKQTAAKNDQIQVNAAKTDQTQGVAATNSLLTLQQSAQGLNGAQALNQQLKADPSRMSNLKWFSVAPATLQTAAAKGMLGQGYQQAATDAQTLNNAAIDAGKFELSGVTGSMSDDQWNKAIGAVPKAGDAPEVWDNYFGRASNLLNSRVGFYQQLAQRGQDAGNRSVNPAGSNGRPDIQVPGTPSSGVSNTGSASPPKVASAADYNALPKGAVFVDPNGVTRTKQ